ncbi:phosphonopyruvate decarboxylase [Saccharicrinis sp. FJH2]|uniref:phosphonopyruvate decarboxylase n=1 Tax=Saccharicrinis sp. FJH65 TaxID=3344659 RepID=UPI0035F31298
MINPELFYELLNTNQINFYTGVPDSLLKEVCACITDRAGNRNNIIAANEGNAVAIACGYYLATEGIPLVYMQNSGLGNTVNPLLSLADQDVYNIPVLLLIGWRGEPGIKDEPQHVKQGKVTLDLLDSMGIEYSILPDSFEETEHLLLSVLPRMHQNKKPHALIVRKGTFSKYIPVNKHDEVFSLTREKATERILGHMTSLDVVVSTTGKTSRELFEIRERNGEGHHRDFLTVGSMGHANQIALGIALQKTDRKIFCFDGDGAVLMHCGGMGIIGDLAPSNFIHIILNNGAHESVGGQPTIGYQIDFEKIARGFNYKYTFSATTFKEIDKIMEEIKVLKGPILIEVKIAKGARKDLGRPTVSPIENKENFIKFLKHK